MPETCGSAGPLSTPLDGVKPRSVKATLREAKYLKVAFTDIRHAKVKCDRHRAYADFAGGAPAAVLEKLGIGVRNVGSAQVLVIPRTTTRFWNKAGGFGGDAPVTADTMAAVCYFFRDRAVAARSIMISPSRLPDDWAAISAKLIEG